MIEITGERKKNDGRRNYFSTDPRYQDHIKIKRRRRRRRRHRHRCCELFAASSSSSSSSFTFIRFPIVSLKPL
jgi:hypothetical protein